MKLIGLNAGREFLRIINAIPYCEGEFPIGCFFVAPPGSGKTFLLTSTHSKDFILVSDITAYGMEKLLLDLTRAKSGYVVVPDLLRCMSRKQSFEQLVSLLNLLLEEGVRVIKRQNLDLNLIEPLRFGFITALTTAEFQKILPQFMNTGLLSRIIVFSFYYEPSDVQRIKDVILSTKEESFKTRLNGVSKVDVKIPSKLKNLLYKISSSTPDKYGFRTLKLYRKLCKAKALLNGRDKVTKTDIMEVFCFVPFISFASDLKIHGGSDLQYFILKRVIKRPVHPDDLKLKGYEKDEIDKSVGELMKRGLIKIARDGKIHANI